MAFPAMIRCSDESDLQDKGLILTHSSSTTRLGGEDIWQLLCNGVDLPGSSLQLSCGTLLVWTTKLA